MSAFLSLGLGALLVPVLVVVLSLLVLIADIAMPGDSKRGLGTMTVAGVAGILGATWLIEPGVLPTVGFGGAYVHDGFTVYVERILLLAGALGALGSMDAVDRDFPRRGAEYYMLLLWSLVGMLVLAGAREIVTFVVAFELMGIPLYVLAAMHKQKAGIEGALKLYLTGAVSSVFMLYGLSFVVGEAGTTMISELAVFEATPLFVLGALMTLAGMGFKIGAVPFHFWVPDTYQGAPTAFVAFLSTAPKVAGFAALVRLYLEGFGGLRTTWWPVLLVICVVTMVLGNLLALPQTNVKRLLAFSGVAHIGLLLLAFGLGTVEGVGMLLFYLLAYVPTNMGAFFVADVVGRNGSDELPAYNGLITRAPALSFAMLIFLLSLGGIPFVAGFWAKILLFWAVWKAGMWMLVLLGASLAVLALFYYLKVGRSIFIEAAPEDAPAIAPVGRPTAWAIGLSVAGVLGIGLMPRPFIDEALIAAAMLLGG